VRPDVIVVGAGAAGLATAIFLKRADRTRSVRVLDGARKPGAKILVSGGTRCNVTNRAVSESDFWGGRRSIVKRILSGFTADDTIRFFRDLGVPLHEEAGGKLFPDSGRARDILDALLNEVHAAGATLLADHRVRHIARSPAGFRLDTSQGPMQSDCVVLATGGLSLPKTGSDGAGLRFAERFGHTIVPTTPALAPLVLDETGMHRDLSGVSHEAELALWIDGRVATRLAGSLLWTHFGISGPVALDASRHWLRAEIEKRSARLTLNFLPGSTFDSQDMMWTAMTAERPRITLLNALSGLVPASVAAAMLSRLALDPSRLLAHLPRRERRRLVHALVEWPLPVTGCRGYNVAEATAGGVALDEINPATLESRLCPGLFLVGEMLDVDGRIGGFNFQWAWSTAHRAGAALAARKTTSSVS